MPGTVDSTVVRALAAAYAVSVLAYAAIHPPYAAMISFLLPTAAAIVYVLFNALASKSEDPRAGAYDAVTARLIFFVLALHGLILIGLLLRSVFDRPTAIVARATLSLVGTALIVVGNWLPRVGPNPAIGVRTPRTLGDRGVWLRTNRIAGYVSVALGACLFAIAALVPLGPPSAIAVGIAASAAIAGLAIGIARCARG